MHQSLHLCSKEMALHAQIWLTTLCFVVTIWSFIPILGWLQTLMRLTLASLSVFEDAHTYPPHGIVNGKTTNRKMQPDITHLPYLPKNDAEALILVPLATLLLCHVLYLSLPLQLPFLLSRVHLCQRPILALTKGCQIIGNWRESQINEVLCGMR